VLRLSGYLGERFPPVAYTLLVGLFFGSAVSVATVGGVGVVTPGAWAGSAVMWLAFFHLRVFDEHKDAASDLAAYPDRLLSRGVVTLPLLTRVAVVAVLAEAGLSASIGTRALLAWAGVFVFTLLMRVEFGLGRWIRPRILLYAVTHNPVVGLLAIFGWACTTAPWIPRFLFYVAAASIGSLAFEIARKTRLADEEVPGVDSYSSVHGRRRVTGILWALAAATVGCAFWIGPIAGGISAAGGLISVVLAAPGRRAKHVELGGTLLLLMTLLGALVETW
jgi:hypothetical protein